MTASEDVTRDEASVLAREFNRIEFFEPDPALEQIAVSMLDGKLTPEEALGMAVALHDNGRHPAEQRRMWDPFGDRAKNGILRNAFGTSDPAKLEKLEFISITFGMREAMQRLRNRSTIGLDAWLETHRLLFSRVFPSWAGHIRSHDVSRGPVRFNLPHLIPKEAPEIFRQAAAPGFFGANLGLVYGELAFHHPFYDGNGRSLNTVFNEMLRREGLRLDWARLQSEPYLAALTPAVRVRDYEALDTFLGSLVGPL